MGRTPSRWLNLPKGMRARERGQKVWYYLDTGARPRREIPLGSDYALAVQKWAELTSRKTPAGGVMTVDYMVAKYFELIVPTKAPSSQRSDEIERAWVLKFFEGAPLEDVQPQHIRQFMRWRADESRRAAIERAEASAKKTGKPAKPVPADHGQVRANRAKALFSHTWNFAREEGMTAAPNPCTGVRKFREHGRETAPDTEMVLKVLRCADKPLQFAMRLAELIGQRPADVRKITEADIKDGMLHVRQGKTKAKLRIEVTGELAVLLDEIRQFKRGISGGVRSLALLVNERGQPLSDGQMRYRFTQAREEAGVELDDFQFRDFRAKAATEADDVAGTRTAQSLLGHTTEAMTSAYIRHKSGRRVKPLR